MDNLTNLHLTDVLALQYNVMGELQRRGVSRSISNPVGQLAEYLFSGAFGWTLARSGGVTTATSAKGSRIRIRSRRVAASDAEANFTAINEIDDESFDWVALVVFHQNWAVCRAAVMPVPLAQSLADPENGRLDFSDATLKVEGVFDATEMVTRQLARG
ncbi:hypothetical protein ATO13_03855 [Stappia sp. 22II-S9-Z10]|nr:hypothetical protein ATO13_03855 [Stappia sp. 22II-S9-Z10]